MAECLSPEMRLGGLKRARNEPTHQFYGGGFGAGGFGGGFGSDYGGFDENTSMQTQEEAPGRRTKRARFVAGDEAGGSFAAAQGEAQLRQQLTEALETQHAQEKAELMRRAEEQLRSLQAQAEGERGALSRAMDESQEENRILKRAVKVLNGKHHEAVRKGQELEASLRQASEYVRKLEQTNYALRVHLEQAGPSAAFTHGPPDVY